ncbi:MAG: hypothetical protein FWC43_07190 [Planctomycetaceae bacterium]|nr:hypothetical protein [Planctomycetaceae bacterium]
MSRILQENHSTASPDRRLCAKWMLSPNPARLYQKVELTLEITHSPDLELVPLHFGDTLGDFTVSRVVVSTPQIIGQREIHRVTIGLAPNSAGQCQIGAIPIQCKGRITDDSLSILIPVQEIKVFTMTVSETSPVQLHHAAGPRSIPDHSGYYWGLGLLLLLFALAGLFRWSRRKSGTLPPVGQSTPAQIAMKKLALLLDRRLHERDVKKFYFEISAIVREFIEQVTEIRAPELTTEEFLQEIKRIADQNALRSAVSSKRDLQAESSIPTKPQTNPKLITLATATGRFRIQQAALIASDLPATPSESVSEIETSPSSEWNLFFSEKNRVALAAFLEIADLVKFARFQPTQAEIMLCFRRASEFLEWGRPLEKPSLRETFPH